MKAKPKQAAPVRGTVHAETGKPPVKASKPVKAARSAAVAFDPVRGIVRAAGAKPAAEIVEKAIKARAAAIGIDPKKVFVGMVGAKPATPAKPAEVKKPEANPAPVKAPAKPAEKPKAEAKPAAQAAPPKPAETWEKMSDRHKREIAEILKGKSSAPMIRLLSGMYVAADCVAAYHEALTRQADERRKLRDDPATARAVYEYALARHKGDEIVSLYEIGLRFIGDIKSGIVVPLLRGNKPLALAWRDALQAVKPEAVSVIVTVRALPKPKAEKPAEKPQTAPAKSADKPKPAEKPKPAPVKAEKPVGMGMVAKIEAKPAAPAKPGKAKKK